MRECPPPGGTWYHVAGLSTAAFDQKKSARHSTLLLSSHQSRYIFDTNSQFTSLCPYESAIAGSFRSRPRPSETEHGSPRQLQGGPRPDEILPAKGPVPTKAHDPLRIDHHIWRPLLASPIIARALDLCLLVQDDSWGIRNSIRRRQCRPADAAVQATPRPWYVE